MTRAEFIEKMRIFFGILKKKQFSIFQIKCWLNLSLITALGTM